MKSGTSTLVGVMNTDENTFITYELFTNIKKRKKFCRDILKNKALADIDDQYDLYNSIYNEISKTHKYENFGDKVTIDQQRATQEFIHQISNNTSICITRDIRTWIPKVLNNNATAMEYDNKCRIGHIAYVGAKVLMFSRKFKMGVVRFEDLNSHNDQWVNTIYKHTGIQINKDNWWEKINIHKSGPKSMPWWKGHTSSLVKPGSHDVLVKLKDNEFWDVLLPIFDKYYNDDNLQLSNEEVDKDIEELKSITKFQDIKLTDLYNDIVYMHIESGNVVKRIVA